MRQPPSEGLTPTRSVSEGLGGALLLRPRHPDRIVAEGLTPTRTVSEGLGGALLLRPRHPDRIVAEGLTPTRTVSEGLGRAFLSRPRHPDRIVADGLTPTRSVISAKPGFAGLGATDGAAGVSRAGAGGSPNRAAGLTHPGNTGATALSGTRITGGLNLLTGGTVIIDNTTITGNTATTSNNDVLGTFITRAIAGRASRSFPFHGPRVVLIDLYRAPTTHLFYRGHI